MESIKSAVPTAQEKIVTMYDLFPPSEGEIIHIYGKPRAGKTYAGTQMALERLNRGEIVYTTWPIKWDGYDERKIWYKRLWGALGFKKTFVYFPPANWHWLKIDRMTPREFITAFSRLTDCTVIVDEAQRPFDSYMLTSIPEEMRNMITATGHVNRSIIVISQRTMTVHTQMRSNAHYFILCEKLSDGWRPFGIKIPWFWRPLFSRTCFEKVKSDGVPDETRETETDEDTGQIIETNRFKWAEWQKFKRMDPKIANAYDSKYLRGNIPSSQNNYAQIIHWPWLTAVKKLITIKSKVE